LLQSPPQRTLLLSQKTDEEVDLTNVEVDDKEAQQEVDEM
jgi:hypothetical protein